MNNGGAQSDSFRQMCGSRCFELALSTDSHRGDRVRVVLTEPGTYLIAGVSNVGEVKANLTPTQLLLDGGQRGHAPSGTTLAA